MMMNALRMDVETYAKMNGLVWYMFTVIFLMGVGVMSFQSGDVSLLIKTSILFAFVETFYVMKEIKDGQKANNP